MRKLQQIGKTIKNKIKGYSTSCAAINGKRKANLVSAEAIFHI